MRRAVRRIGGIVRRAVSARVHRLPEPLPPLSEGLPPEFDPAFYRRSNVDMAGRSDAALRRHFDSHGRDEGRAGSAPALREHLLQLAESAGSVLEIGPFCNPCMTGPNVRYFDVMDSDGLKARAEAIGYPIRSVPRIDWHSPVGDLAVVSAHCIEHQPDLVGHIAAVARLLNPSGHYFAIIPDKRYCFDHGIAPSTAPEIVAAHLEGRKVHRLTSVIEHRAFITHNDPVRHWAGDNFPPNWEATILPRAKAARAEYLAAEGGYIDVHAWQFTPASLRAVMGQLAATGLLQLRLERVYDTARNRNEFTAIFRKP